MQFDQVIAEQSGSEDIIRKLVAFNVAIPSWALGTGGTRFGRFSGGGEPRSLEEKIEDVGLIHALNKSSNSISLHIPWDIPSKASAIKTLAAQFGLHFDAVNSNTFQDQPDQKYSYKFGSLHHVEKAVRKQAMEHNIEVIQYGVALGSKALSVWLSDGSNFPGQLNFRTAFQNTLESLREIYAAFQPTGKYGLNTNLMNLISIPQPLATGDNLIYSRLNWATKPAHWLTWAIICREPISNRSFRLLLMKGKLAGFHFNDSKYGDDDLTVGSINPYQLFLIFNELVEGMDARGMNHAKDLGWMIDASHNVKDPIEDLLQSVEAIKIAYAQALVLTEMHFKKPNSRMMLPWRRKFYRKPTGLMFVHCWQKPGCGLAGRFIPYGLSKFADKEST